MIHGMKTDEMLLAGLMYPPSAQKVLKSCWQINLQLEKTVSQY
jgi:hypothetical protein